MFILALHVIRKFFIAIFPGIMLYFQWNEVSTITFNFSDSN